MFIVILVAFFNMAQAENFCIKGSDKLKTIQSKIDHWQSALSEKKASFYPQAILTKNLILSFSENRKKDLMRRPRVINIKNHHCVEQVIYTSTLKDAELGQGFKKGTTIQLQSEDAQIEYLPLFKTLYFSFIKKQFSIKIKLRGKSCSLQDIQGPLLEAGLEIRVIYPENNKECENYQKSLLPEDKIDFESQENIFQNDEIESQTEDTEEKN